MAQSEFPSTPTEIVRFYFKDLVVDSDANHPSEVDIDRVIFEEYRDLVFEQGGSWNPERREDWKRGSQRILRSAREIGLAWATKAEEMGEGVGIWLNLNGEKVSVALNGKPQSVYSSFGIHRISPHGRDDISLKRYQGGVDDQEPVLITSVFDPEQTTHGDVYIVRFSPRGLINQFSSSEGEFSEDGKYIGRIQTSLQIDPSSF